jgi:Transposase DDE domain
MKSHYIGCAALTHWLTPAVWKQAHQADRRRRMVPRWNMHALVTVLTLMTFVSGDSEAECFATARAFYVASRQQQKRPGQSLSGFQRALAKLPLPVLHALFAAVRARVAVCLGAAWRYQGFVVMACDGSRLECPRSQVLERRLGCCGKPSSAPMLQVTALVLLPAGLLWSWCVDPGTTSELVQLLALLPSLPKGALLVADAGYLSYDLYAAILQAQADFLVRLSSRAYLYSDEERPLKRYREGLVWYWPEAARTASLKPLRLRLFRLPGKKGQDVWLLTSVLDPARLGRASAGQIYRWRWRIEGVYRTYKRTLPKLKLRSRTEALVNREAEVSLLALQVLLLSQVNPHAPAPTGMPTGGSPRRTLLQLRGEITIAVGSKLGPRQQRWYRVQLQDCRSGGPGRKVRRKWPRRKDHQAPKPPKLRVIPETLKPKFEKYLMLIRDDKR